MSIYDWSGARQRLAELEAESPGWASLASMTIVLAVAMAERLGEDLVAVRDDAARACLDGGVPDTETAAFACSMAQDGLPMEFAGQGRLADAYRAVRPLLSPIRHPRHL